MILLLVPCVSAESIISGVTELIQAALRMPINCQDSGIDIPTVIPIRYVEKIPQLFCELSSYNELSTCHGRFIWKVILEVVSYRIA